MASRRTSRRKKERKIRGVLSFFLYLCLVGILLCTNFFAVTGNPNTFVKVFTDASYVQDLYSDVVQYATDSAQSNSIPTDFIEKSIKYNSIYEIEKAYISGALEASKQYNENAYLSLLDTFNEEVQRSVKNMVKEQNIKIDSSVKDTAIYDFSKGITTYVQDKVEFKSINELKGFINRTKALCYVVMAISVIGAVVFILILALKGGKDYRGIRSISYSVLATAIMDLIFILAIAIVRATKDLVIYPSYLVGAFMQWVNESMAALSYSAAILFVIFLALACSVWKMKRKEKE